MIIWVNYVYFSRFVSILTEMDHRIRKGYPDRPDTISGLKSEKSSIWTKPKQVCVGALSLCFLSAVQRGNEETHRLRMGSSDPVLRCADDRDPSDSSVSSLPRFCWQTRILRWYALFLGFLIHPLSFFSLLKTTYIYIHIKILYV